MGCCATEGGPAKGTQGERDRRFGHWKRREAVQPVRPARQRPESEGEQGRAGEPQGKQEQRCGRVEHLQQRLPGLPAHGEARAHLLEGGGNLGPVPGTAAGSRPITSAARRPSSTYRSVSAPPRAPREPARSPIRGRSGPGLRLPGRTGRGPRRPFGGRAGLVSCSAVRWICSLSGGSVRLWAVGVRFVEELHRRRWITVLRLVRSSKVHAECRRWGAYLS